MANPVPFRTKKGDVWSQWKAIVNGKSIELGDGNTVTKEEADKKLAEILPATTANTKNPTLGDLLKKSETKAPEASSTSTGSNTSTTPKPDKPKPTELRKNGLSELSPERLKNFREKVASAIASGNVTLDRALVAIFRDEVPILTPEQHYLLSIGWELACEQFFVNGVPPAWIVILLGNAMVVTALVEKSKPKAEKPEEGKAPIEPARTAANGTQKDK
jgi:hypothetical protein